MSDQSGNRRPFKRISDAEWSILVTRLPKNCARNLRYVRTDIDHSLFCFARGSWFVKDEEGNEWHEREMADRHRRLASALRRVIEAFDWGLYPIALKRHDEAIEAQKKLLDDFQNGKNGNVVDHLLRVAKLTAKQHKQEAKDYDNLMDYLSQIADRAEKEAAGFDELRRMRVSDQVALVDRLIIIWRDCGGKIGGGTQGGKGGPLIRFLIDATRPALPTVPTTETVRHWIRDFKRRGARYEAEMSARNAK